MVIIFWKSLKASRKAFPLIYESPNPIVNDNNKAVITSINGGIPTVK